MVIIKKKIRIIDKYGNMVYMGFWNILGYKNEYIGVFGNINNFFRIMKWLYLFYNV